MGAAPIGRPFGSPDGARFIVLLDTDLSDASADEVLVLFEHGAPTPLMLAAQEGTSPLIPSAGGPFPPFSFDPVQGINNAGSYAFSGLDDRPSTSNDGFVAKVVGGVVAMVVQEATTPASSVGTGVFFGSLQGSVSIAADNTVSFIHNLSGSVVATNDTGMFGNDGAALLAREGVSIPGNQVDNIGVPTAFTFKSFDFGSVSTGMSRDAGAALFLSSGAINASTNLPTTSGVDRVLVVGQAGQIAAVVQENVILPGTGFTLGTDDVAPFSSARMEAHGDWFACGGNRNQLDWVLRSGEVVATTDAPIAAGSGELFDDTDLSGTFFLASGNAWGEWVVGGSTNAANGLTDEVVVLNNATVLCRENDPVDLNANGQFDDNTYIQAFLKDRAFLADGALYAAVRLRDGAAAGGCGPDVEVGQAIIRVAFTPLPRCGSADFNADGDTGTDLDIEAFFACLGGNCCPTCGSADFNADGDTGTDIDIEAFFRVLAGGSC